MEICVLAKIVLLLSIIGISFDVCIFGFSLLIIVVDILFTLILVAVTNWYCEYWVAKGIVGVSVIFVIISIFMCFTKNEIYKKTIEDETKRQLK